MKNNTDRSDILTRVRERKNISVLIVGAGINGASTFFDLAHQGVDVLLIDKGDVASGASSASSRMVHGGLRYLENAEFKLVAESTLERNLLLKNAHHLVKPLKIVVPYASWFGGMAVAVRKMLRLDGPSAGRGGALIKIGLSVYDFLGRHARTLPSHKVLTRSELRKTVKGILPSAVGGARYYDAWIPHPERLNLELVLDALAVHPTSDALFYARLDRVENGDAVIVDTLTDEEIRVRPDIMVNATGAWIDFTNAATGIGGRLIGGTKGSHLVVKNAELKDALGDSMLWFEAKDGRTCIAFPFLGNVLLGSTDIRIDNPEDAICNEDEIAYMIRVLAEVLPTVHVTPADVIFHFSGVRPLPWSDAKVTAAISRDHTIEVSEIAPDRPFPVLSLVGGKWTTFRSFGEDATDLVLHRLGMSRSRSTKDIPIGGAQGLSQDAREISAMVDKLAKLFSVPASRVETLVERYGSIAEEAAAVCSARHGGDHPLANLPDYSIGEIEWISKTQLVTHLEDILLRRTLIGMRGQLTQPLIEEISLIAGDCLRWTSERRATEVSDLWAKLVREHGFSPVEAQFQDSRDAEIHTAFDNGRNR
ncbi:glycerol-3-phosphate dehydrogenase/oxidase [Rhizobium leguminosarum]